MFRVSRFVAVATFAIGAVVVSPRSAAAQGFGVKIGPIFTDFQSAKDDFKGNTGVQAGVFFGGNREGILGVQGELLYAKKGAENVDLHYLEIPILARLNIGTRSRNGIGVYALGGPAFDVKL
jgi:hypothetical protein